MSGPDGAKAIAGVIVEFIKGIRQMVASIRELFGTIGNILRSMGGGSIAGGMVAVFGKVIGFFQMVISVLNLIAVGVEHLVAYFVGPTDTQLKARDIMLRQKGINPDELRNVGGLGIDVLGEEAVPSVADSIKIVQELEAEQRKAQEASYMIALAVADGWSRGLQEKQPAIVAATDIFGKAAMAVKDTLGIHSPSKVFEYFGIQTGAGYAHGLGRARAMVSSAANDNLVEPSLSPMSEASLSFPSISSAMEGGNKPSINITVNIEGGGSADELAAKVKAATVEAVTEALEKAGMEIGAAA